MQTEACVQHSFLKIDLLPPISAWGWQVSVSQDTTAEWAQVEHHATTLEKPNLPELYHPRETLPRIEEHYKEHQTQRILPN